MRKMNCAALGLGSNLGNKARNICIALKYLSGFCGIIKVSSVYKTRSLLNDSQNDYFNICALIWTDFEPSELLAAVKNIEKIMGRENTGRWYSRIIDIDIIDYDQSVFQSDALTVPHPEMENRSFVLMPLQEIFPDYAHPVHCRKISDMVKNISDDLGISKLGVLTWRL